MLQGSALKSEPSCGAVLLLYSAVPQAPHTIHSTTPAASAWRGCPPNECVSDSANIKLAVSKISSPFGRGAALRRGRGPGDARVQAMLVGDDARVSAASLGRGGKRRSGSRAPTADPARVAFGVENQVEREGQLRVVSAVDAAGGEWREKAAGAGCAAAAAKRAKASDGPRGETTTRCMSDSSPPSGTRQQQRRRMLSGAGRVLAVFVALLLAAASPRWVLAAMPPQVVIDSTARPHPRCFFSSSTPCVSSTLCRLSLVVPEPTEVIPLHGS